MDTKKDGYNLKTFVNKMEINIEGVRKFDLQNAIDAIDYLCYLTENKYSLVNLTLYHTPDKRLLTDFRDDFTNEKRKLYKYILCYNRCRDFNSTFLDSSNKFIFNDYFLNNTKSTDLEKKSRLRLILNNINNLMNEILETTQRINFEITSDEQAQEIEKEFENKFESKLFICYDYNSNPIKISAYPLYLLWFCLGIGLKKTYDKLMVEYSSYVEHHYTSINPINTEGKSQDIRFLSSERPYGSNYEKLFKQYLGDPLIKIQHQKKRPNWELVFLEILNGNIYVENNVDDMGGFLCKYKKEEFKTPTQLGEKTAEVLNGKKDTIRPILTETIYESGDKQIFTEGHKDAINSILKQEDNKMCVFFQKQLDKLN